MFTLERASGTRRVGIWSVVGLILIPLLVAGGFLWATWDSSSRLGRVQAAVVNLDEPVTIDGQLVPLGRQLAGGLVNGDPDRPEENFDWVLTDTDDAADGLATGRYAAVVTIPEDFSADATSISKSEAAEIQPAEITVEVSQVSGIADSAVGQVITETARNELNTQLTERYLDNIYLGFNQMGEQFVTLADGAQQLADGATQLSDGVAAAADGTEQLASGLGQLDSGAAELASGADQLSAGTAELADGLQTMADETAALPGGAEKLASGGTDLAQGVKDAADGVTQYIEDGVGSLRHGTEDRPGGTAEFAAGAQQFADGVVTYQQTMQGYTQLSDEELGQIVPCPVPEEQCPVFYAGLRAGIGVGISGFDDQQTPNGEVPGLVNGSQQLADGAAGLDAGVGVLIDKGNQIPPGLDKLADGADTYAAGVSTFAAGMGPLHDGIVQVADGASELSSGVAQYAAGVGQFADGVELSADGADELSDGMDRLATGASKLADGTQEFATGVAEGKDKLPSYDEPTREKLATVVTTPVTAERTAWLYADQATTTFLAVVALWVGALATYLIVAAVPGRVLTSTEPAWRLALSGLWPGAAIAAIQAIAFTVVLQILLDLDAGQVARLLPLALLAGVAFVAVNHALVAWFGGIGRFISVVVLVLSAAGAITLAVPPFFDVLRPLLPPTSALAGFRAVVTDGPGAGAAAGALLGWLIVGVAAGVVAVARHRVVSPLAVPVAAPT